MSEIPSGVDPDKQNNEKELTPLQKLGRVVGYTGRQISEALQNLIKKDPKKLEEFMNAAEEGQRSRQRHDREKTDRERDNN